MKRIGWIGAGALMLVSTTQEAAAQSAAVSAVAGAGRQYYVEYCASCHGIDARGNGPVAGELRAPPPDLTQIAKRRGGAFPLDELAEVIDGTRALGAHGTREMPVWGDAFAAEYAGEDQQHEMVRGKILMLLVYLESIQE